MQQTNPGTESPKKMSKGTKVLLIIAIVILSMAIVLAGIVFVLDRRGRESLRSTEEEVKEMTVIENEDAEVVAAGRVRYKGQLYQYRDDLITVLLMGIDTEEKDVEEGSFGRSNQSDTNVLAVLDPRAKKIKLISVSRDAMCKMDVLDKNGEFEGTATAQLALAYSFGDGGTLSCELTEKAVSDLFYGLPISAYASIYMDGIAELIDFAGGVTITPNVSFLKFREGENVKVDGEKAMLYLRYREQTVEGNLKRMERQRSVMMALAHTMLGKIRSNPTSVLAMYSQVRKNVTTDLNTEEMVYLARLASGMTMDNELHNVAGTAEIGAQDYVEFKVDETALYEMILDIFYEPVKDGE